MNTRSTSSLQTGVPGLNLPDAKLDTVNRDGRIYVLDPVRKKFVRLTPEEEVRQRILRYLLDVVGAPAGLTAVESGFEYNGMFRRADVVVHDRSGSPLILVECKAPDVSLSQTVFDQAGRYNSVVGARYVLVSNGWQHYCFLQDTESDVVRFVDELPQFDDMQEHTQH